MFAANVFTIIDSQDMQERNRLGPVALTPGDAPRKGRGLKIAHRFWSSRDTGDNARRTGAPDQLERYETKTVLFSACRNRLLAGSPPAGWHDER